MQTFSGASINSNNASTTPDHTSFLRPTLLWLHRWAQEHLLFRQQVSWMWRWQLHRWKKAITLALRCALPLPRMEDTAQHLLHHDPLPCVQENLWWLLNFAKNVEALSRVKFVLLGLLQKHGGETWQTQQKRTHVKIQNAHSEVTITQWFLFSADNACIVFLQYSADRSA